MLRKVIFQCEECAEPIRDGDIFYEFSNGRICSRCCDRHLRIADWEKDGSGELSELFEGTMEALNKLTVFGGAIK